MRERSRESSLWRIIHTIRMMAYLKGGLKPFGRCVRLQNFIHELCQGFPSCFCVTFPLEEHFVRSIFDFVVENFFRQKVVRAEHRFQNRCFARKIIVREGLIGKKVINMKLELIPLRLL